MWWRCSTIARQSTSCRCFALVSSLPCLHDEKGVLMRPLLFFLHFLICAICSIRSLSLPATYIINIMNCVCLHFESTSSCLMCSCECFFVVWSMRFKCKRFPQFFYVFKLFRTFLLYFFSEKFSKIHFC